MPDVIIQSDGSFLIPRGYNIDNQFFSELLENIVNKKTYEALQNFFAFTEDSEIIFGSPGLCG